MGFSAAPVRIAAVVGAVAAAAAAGAAAAGAAVCICIHTYDKLRGCWWQRQP